MAVLVLPETIAELLADLLRRRHINQRQLAAYLNASPAAVNDWLMGKRTPDPKYVWKIASLAKIPVEEVMRIAGHLPPVDDAPEPETMPDWARLIPELTPDDAAYVGRLVESLARNPVHPDEESGQAGQ